MGTTTKRGEDGWRLLRSGEYTPMSGPCRIWYQGSWAWIDCPEDLRGDPYDAPNDSSFARGYFAAVPIDTAPKNPKAKKAPKSHTWTQWNVVADTSVTKIRMAELLHQAVDKINAIGTENAKLKNQLAALRRKTKKGEA